MFEKMAHLAICSSVMGSHYGILSIRLHERSMCLFPFFLCWSFSHLLSYRQKHSLEKVSNKRIVQTNYYNTIMSWNMYIIDLNNRWNVFWKVCTHTVTHDVILWKWYIWGSWVYHIKTWKHWTLNPHLAEREMKGAKI